MLRAQLSDSANRAQKRSGMVGGRYSATSLSRSPLSASPLPASPLPASPLPASLSLSLSLSLSFLCQSSSLWPASFTSASFLLLSLHSSLRFLSLGPPHLFDKLAPLTHTCSGRASVGRAGGKPSDFSTFTKTISPEEYEHMSK